MSVPLALTGGLIVVSARVVGPAVEEELKLAVDTGSTWTLIRPAVLADLGYDLAGAPGRDRIMIGSTIETVIALRIAPIEALGRTWRNRRVIAHQLSAALRVDGLLGLDLLGGGRLTIDFRLRTIELE